MREGEKNEVVVVRAVPVRRAWAAIADGAEVVATQPVQRQVHVILDNLATHKTELVQHFLQHHPNVNLHFTPTYSSWLIKSRVGSASSSATSSTAASSLRLPI